MRSQLWDTKPSHSEITNDIRDYLQTRLEVEPQLRIVGMARVRERLETLHAGKLREAERLHREGQRYYDRGDLRRAIRSFEKSLKTYRECYFDVLAPDALADLLLTLAHARSEVTGLREDRLSAERNQAGRDLEDMFFLNPDQRVAKGFYPVAFEDLLEDALSDFRASSLRRENRLGVKPRLRQFKEDLDVDTVVLPYLERDGSDIHLRVVVFDSEVATARFDGVVIPEAPADGQDRLDRFISAWLTCLPTGSPITRSEDAVANNRFFIDTGFAYSIYGKFTTRRLFHNLGMGLSAEYQFLRGLGVFGQINLFTSTQDPDRDLLDSFTSVRTTLGLSYAFRGQWWRVYVRFGFDVQFLGSYVTTTDPWCKFAGQADSRCTESEFTDLGSGKITMGIHGGFGVQFFVTRNIYLTVRASTSAYIVPLNENTVVNFPVTSELALGYSF